MPSLLLAAFLFAPIPQDSTEPTVRAGPIVQREPPVQSRPTVGAEPTEQSEPTVHTGPIVGAELTGQTGPTFQAEPIVQLVFPDEGPSGEAGIAGGDDASLGAACGWVLDPHFSNALASHRRPDGVNAWTLVKCTVPPYFVITELQWTVMERSYGYWSGFADWAVWDVEVVEQGCADNSNTRLAEWDVPNTRKDEPFDCCICDWTYCFHYTMPVEIELPAGDYYIGVRNYCDRGQSFILTRDCAGDSPIYFQSFFFGFPCAVPGREVFGNDYCAQVAIFGETHGPCDLVRRVTARCTNGKIKGIAKTDLAEGTPLTLTNDGADPKRVRVNKNGKAKARWTHQTGTHRICVAECGQCRRTDCGG